MNAITHTSRIEFLLKLSRQVDSRTSSSSKHHSTRVARWVRAVAQAMDCSREQVETYYWAALLHDIGKIGIPESVLVKTTPLSEHDWTMIKLHPTVGANIVLTLRGLAHIAPVIMAHQEKWDGSGYPHGLRSLEIPFGARILAVVDAYDAMTSDRVYRQARGAAEAARELREQCSRHFDPQVVKAFLSLLRTR